MPAAQHAARREPGRDPGLARHRHARLPADAAQLRRRGPRRATRPPQLRETLQALRAHRHGTPARSPASCSKRRAQHPPRDPQLPGAGHRAGLQGPPAGGVRGLGQRQLRGDRQPGAPTCASRCACCPDTLAQTRDTLTDRRPRWRPTSAPRSSKLRPGARALGAHPAPGAARSCATTTPIIRNELRPVRPRRRARPCATPREAAEDLAVVTPRLTSTVRGAELALQHARLQPAAAARRATCSGPPGSTTRARRCSGSQDAHGPVRRGLVMHLVPRRSAC